MMGEQEIRSIVSAVIAEQENHYKAAVSEAVSAALVSFGIHEDERKEMRADFQHLRAWRLSVETAQTWMTRSVVATLVTGLAAALWLGLKAYVGK